MGLAMTSTSPPLEEPEFIYVSGGDHDFEVARSICTARDRQLPEVYTEDTSLALTDFLKANNVPFCVAGITHDLVHGIARFASTGIPVWNGFHHEAIWANNKINLTIALDDYGSLFTYTDNGTLKLQLNSHNAATHGRLGDTRYRNDKHELWFTMGPVICQKKWDGIIPTEVYTGVRGVDVKIGPIVKRDLAAHEVNSHVAPGFGTSYAVCKSLATRANEAYRNAWEELSDLLGQIDISMRSSNTVDRRKRFIGIIAKKAVSYGARFAYKKLKPGRFKFSSGTKWHGTYLVLLKRFTQE